MGRPIWVRLSVCPLAARLSGVSLAVWDGSRGVCRFGLTPVVLRGCWEVSGWKRLSSFMAKRRPDTEEYPRDRSGIGGR